MKKVLIVDDHPMIRLAVRMMLERGNYQVVGEADNGVDAITLVREHEPNLVILDIGIPKLDGLEVIARLNSLPAPVKVLVLTGQSSERYAVRCMKAGAAGFVCKEGDLTELLAAAHAVLSGYNYFPSQVLVHSGGKQTIVPGEAELIDSLSDRELAVLQRLASGFTNIEISEQLLISNKTVSTYKSRLQLKLNVFTLLELIELAKRNALL